MILNTYHYFILYINKYLTISIIITYFSIFLLIPPSPSSPPSPRHLVTKPLIHLFTSSPYHPISSSPSHPSLYHLVTPSPRLSLTIIKLLPFTLRYKNIKFRISRSFSRVSITFYFYFTLMHFNNTINCCQA